jgi:AraC family transcriptional regulator
MLDSASAVLPTAFWPSSVVARQSVVCDDVEQGLRPKTQNRTGLNTSRPGLHLTAIQAVDQIVQISPCDAVRRRSASWTGMDVEIVQANRRGRIDYRYCGPLHMLVIHERGVRQAGCTVIEGLPPSTLQDCSRSILFVPAGYAYHDWHEPRTLSRTAFFFFKSPVPAPSPELGFPNSSLAPRLFFKDSALMDTALKLATLIESGRTDHRLYLEALGTVLLYELARTSQASYSSEGQTNGGLAAWQRRKAVTYIEQHLAEPISLAALAQMAGLSSCYFCRAFRQSFGVPPQRYQLSQRIERAKTLLAKHAASVTDVSVSVGYNDTSAFCTAFRRITGLTPSAYRRGIS